MSELDLQCRVSTEPHPRQDQTVTNNYSQQELDLDAIRERDRVETIYGASHKVHGDRRALLAEVDRLSNALADAASWQPEAERLQAEVDRLRAERQRAWEEKWEQAERAARAERETIATARQRDTANAELDRLRPRLDSLASALGRTEANLRTAVNGHPVRDMAENLAENATALNETEIDRLRERKAARTCGHCLGAHVCEDPEVDDAYDRGWRAASEGEGML